ncbi:MAG: SUMF1/EgtB/PvdO family nonheme iron enzyme [Myxococcota bacterium]|nr:SUMF1/EgtB/PvdO family nonheme iron enzyme [Myxococcota bacterium]
MFYYILLACGTSSKPQDSAQSDTGGSIVDPNDYDGDGYPDWRTTTDYTIADCDDTDPAVTPETERWIPAGVFTRGDDIAPGAGPIREIYLSDYCMDVTEVTNEDFVDFMVHRSEIGSPNRDDDGNLLFDFEDNDDQYPERIIEEPDGSYSIQSGYAQHPVNEVWRWSGIAYCEWKGQRLPTEAEWEKGARGENGLWYPWGEIPPDCELANFGTVNSQCVGDTTPVKSYPEGRSPYGLYDMGGNLAEWVSDWFLVDYYANSPDSDPQGPDYGFFEDPGGNSFEAATARGGNHATGAGDLQTFFRIPEPFDATSNGLGFRCARTLTAE